MRPPRSLYCEFPFGRPLGKPGDPEFQHDVLRRAFALLESPSGPVLADHPEVIVADYTPLTCSLPPRYDPALPSAVDEAQGLRAAYDRTRSTHGRTSVGRVMDADGVADALGMLHRIAAGTPWEEAGLPGKDTTAAVLDIRAYYEEAALALADDPAPAARSAERWFYESTEAGRTVLAAQDALRRAGAPLAVWFYMSPGYATVRERPAPEPACCDNRSNQ